MVKQLLYLDGKEVDAKHFGRSDGTWNFVYRVGETVALGEAEGDMEFNDASKSCVPGVHYFDTLEQAQRLGAHWSAINKSV